MVRLLGILFALLVGWGGLRAEMPQPAAPQHWVTDPQGLLAVGTREGLDRRLGAYQTTTGHQVLVWIGTSTEGMPLETWTARTFAAWKVGRKGLDDGLVLFVFEKDRTLRIEVGYGLEGQMTDALASRILRESLTPRIRAGDWNGGLGAGVDQILQTLGGEGPAEARQRPPPRPARAMGFGQILLLGILGLGFLALVFTHPGLALGLLFSILSGGRGGGGGRGGWSGGGGRSGGGGASGSW